MPRHPFRSALALAVVVALAGACSGSDDDESTSSASSTAAPGSPATTAPAPGSTATPTTVPGPPVYPLTGAPASDPAIAARPALVVKIDNHPDARPQNGLNAADIVFEENVEKLTRFAAVFHSDGADPVGPIRSGRTQDVALLGSFNRPLFAWSGGNDAVTKIIEASDLVDLSAQKAASNKGGGYYRADRPAPHNLYAKTTGLFSLAPAGATPPPRQFTYRAAADPVPGTPRAGVNVAMDGVKVGWKWAAEGSYLRTQNNLSHNDAALGQISAANVVVMFVDYRPSEADANSPEAQTIGSGEVWVYTGGNVVKGTWSRNDRLAPIALTDVAGKAIPLAAGRTWIELARPGSATEI